MRALVVTNPFAGHGLGDTITQPDLIDAVLAGGHSGHVIRVEVADKPAKVNKE